MKLLSMVALSLLAPLGAPVSGAPASAPVEARAQTIELGTYEAPGDGAAAMRGRPEGAPLSDEAAGRGEAPGGEVERSLVLRRDRVEPFSAAGVSWAYHRKIGEVSVAARVLRDGEWTPWQAVSAFEAADESAARHTAARSGSELLWFGPSEGVELAVTAVDGADPERVRLDLIDPGDAPADRDLVRPEAPRPEAPRIRSRAGWGADESKMTWKPEYADELVAITLHHTATSHDYRPEDVPKIIRSIFHYQTVTLEWGDIGYNVLLDRFGRLWEGRAGGLDRPVIGAHAGGFNTRTAGIGMIGSYTETGVPEDAVDAAARYVAWRFAPHKIDPRGSTKITGGPSSKYQKRVTITIPRVFPHRRTSATECPGDQGVSALRPIRARAYKRMR
ncbi:MAG: hypothetical protein GEU94_08165 [Micromonosporaceae bacterium]|nr:hypothetical protein [Micromonosporaceae bacterium]